MISGISTLVPIVVKVIQGTSIPSLESLDADDYETLTIYSVYQYLSTILAFIIGFSYIFYHSLKEYKVQKKLISETVELSQSKTGSSQGQGSHSQHNNSSQHSQYEEVNRLSIVNADEIEVKI